MNKVRGVCFNSNLRGLCVAYGSNFKLTASGTPLQVSIWGESMTYGKGKAWCAVLLKGLCARKVSID